MRTSEDNPQDWFLLAADRLNVADLAQRHEGVTFAGVELLQGAVERYLKGYLVGQGRQLERTHDLGKLIEAATHYDDRFSGYVVLAEKLTDLFWDQHYPGGDLTDFGADYDNLRQQAGEMIALILASAPPPSQPEESE